MKMNRKIGVFDSGIGGTTTLEAIKKLLPYEEYIDYADSKNNPYGEKNDYELKKIVSEIVEYFISLNVKLIVIACNTATTRCINFLREKYPEMIFVGTEPAVKVACDNNYMNTLVMATPLTINSSRLSSLVNENIKDDQLITLLPCDGLAHAIETNDDKEIWLLRYGFAFEDISWLKAYVLDIDENSISFSDTIFNLDDEKKETIGRYI